MLLFSVKVYSQDYPHRGENNIGCNSCHFIFGSQASLLVEGLSYGQNIDDTQYNALCWSCHNDIQANYVRTHSSLQMDNGYGDWAIECKTCHNPHSQKQVSSHGSDSYLVSGISTDVQINQPSANKSQLTKTGSGWTTNAYQGMVLIPNVSNKAYSYEILSNTDEVITVDKLFNMDKVTAGVDTFAIIYGNLIKGSIDLSEIIGLSKTGTKEVKYFRQTGSNSLADNDATYDGICEVCHTQTTFHRNDASGDHAHNSGEKCSGCHNHVDGFNGKGCDNCHGYPPTVDIAEGGPDGLVDSPGVTNSTTAGAHEKHVTTKGFECIICHIDSAGSGPTHNNGAPQDITLGFSLFGGTYLGGIYDGQSAVNYDSSEANTTVINTGTKTCSNIYCHGELPNGTVWGGGQNTTIAWDGSVTCSSCHDEGGSTSGLPGKHPKHTDAARHDIDCEKCHNLTATGSNSIKNESSHVNNTKDVVFNAGGTFNSGTKACTNTYCHSDGSGGDPNVAVAWTDSTTMECDSCHDGRPGQETPEIASNGHARLVGSSWVRQYKCYFCHDDTMDTSNNIKDFSKHVNETKDVVMDENWYITGEADPSYNPETKVCSNVYCHSDGTTLDPDIKDVAWTDDKMSCNSCHGHEPGTCADCHSGDGITGWAVGEEWKSSMPMYANTGAGTARANTHQRHLLTEFNCDNCHANTIANGTCTSCHDGGVPSGDMGEVEHINATYHVNKVKDLAFKNGGTYSQVNKTCSSTACHTGSDPQWGDSVNGNVICMGCHGTTGTDVDDFVQSNDVRAKINTTEWEDTGHGRVTASGNYDSGNPPANLPGNPCIYCHDNGVLHNDSTNPFRLRQHDQFAGRFDKECVYCHMEGLDSECLNCHNAGSSLAPQLADSEAAGHTGYTDGQTSCVASCHATDDDRHDTDSEIWTSAQKDDVKSQYIMMGVCLVCHDDDSENKCTSCHTGAQYTLGFNPGSGLIQGASKATSTHFGYKHYAAFETGRDTHLVDGTVSSTAGSNSELTDTSKSWTVDEWQGKYVMMTSGPNDTENRKIASNTADTLTLAVDFSNPVQAGNTYYLNYPIWKGGKFCWDCHDPHGDSNIFMIQDNVAIETDGTFGTPVATREVVFTRKQSGLDYAKSSPPYNGICNVCHEEDGQHYRFDYGNGHNAGRVCTECHEHRFSDSHASGQACNLCHVNRPIARHEAFGQPRDCTKCHDGIINKRVDIIGQLNSNSHHIQGVDITNKHCYACHWEATSVGTINPDYHSGYNYRTYQSVADAPANLVIWGPGTRPTTYEDGVTAVTFQASKIATDERTEVAKVTLMCLGCHSDQNNDTQPFNIVAPDNGDCKTPRQYAWDRTSIGARYSQTGTTTWGKYTGTSGAAKKDITKAFSAHGNAVNNQGGWSATDGYDATTPDTRNGTENVQCFDCHSSHGSKAEGITSSYMTFNGTYNGANLKETQAGKGGYLYSYKGVAGGGATNPYNVGAAQCFDCHENADKSTMSSGGKFTPWGYNETYGATEPIMGYKDSSKFGTGTKGSMGRYSYRSSKTAVGGHLNASSDLTGLDGTPGTGDENMGTIGGLCTPCHDPHGVSPRLGANQAYAVPLLKGTWLTSPYKEDVARTQGGTGLLGSKGSMRYAGTGNFRYARLIYDDDATFGVGNRIAEDDSQFAGLCLMCHPKENLTDGTNNNGTWKGLDRIHESVKGWGDNAQHSYPCSKCHQVHSSGLPRLVQTNCLDSDHRGRVASGGRFGKKTGSKGGGGPKGRNRGGYQCHPVGSWPDNRWNNVTDW